MNEMQKENAAHIRFAIQNLDADVLEQVIIDCLSHSVTFTSEFVTRVAYAKLDAEDNSKAAK